MVVVAAVSEGMIELLTEEVESSISSAVVVVETLVCVHAVI